MDAAAIIQHPSLDPLIIHTRTPGRSLRLHIRETEGHRRRFSATFLFAPRKRVSDRLLLSPFHLKLGHNRFCLATRLENTLRRDAPLLRSFASLAEIRCFFTEPAPPSAPFSSSPSCPAFLFVFFSLSHLFGEGRKEAEENRVEISGLRLNRNIVSYWNDVCFVYCEKLCFLFI